MLTHYRERLYIKNIQKEKEHTSRATRDFTGLQSVCLLLEISDEVVSSAQKFIKRLSKEADNVEVIAYTAIKELEGTEPFPCFCKKDLDWIWRPKAEIMTQFTTKSYDLLINLCQADCFPIDYLAVAIDANYKIGALRDYPNDYDLILDSKNINSYLEQIYFFIDKFRNN